MLPATAMPVAEWVGSRGIRSVCGFRDYLKVYRSARDREYNTGAVLVVKTKSLQNAVVNLRCGTSDASVFLETLVGRFHEPPVGLDPKRVWDLGANIGLTAAHYAVLFPHARITALEPQPALAAAAYTHTERWRDRCEIVEAAVWTSDASLTFSVTPGIEYGGKIGNAEPGATETKVRAVSLNTLLASDDVVDFLKMDIEGAESAVLSENTEWATKVRCIQVECHGPFTVESCVAALSNLHFRAAVDARHWSSVVGMAPGGAEHHT